MTIRTGFVTCHRTGPVLRANIVASEQLLVAISTTAIHRLRDI